MNRNESNVGDAGFVAHIKTLDVSRNVYLLGGAGFGKVYHAWSGCLGRNRSGTVGVRQGALGDLLRERPSLAPCGRCFHGTAPFRWSQAS